MTMDLITGKGGTAHVTSSNMGAVQAGLIGHGNYLLQNSDGTYPTVTMKDANNASVPVMNLVLEGRYARVTAAETVKVASGMTGRKRNDLLCVKYTRNSNNIETASLVILQGTATADTPTDPSVPAGTIIGQSSTVYAPLARIPIDGITAGTPVMLISKLPPMASMWDSVTLYADKSWTVQACGRMVSVHVVGTLGSGSWDAVDCPYEIPPTFRPKTEQNAAATVSNGQTARMLIVTPAGKIRLANMGGAGSNSSCTATLTYISA